MKEKINVGVGKWIPKVITCGYIIAPKTILAAGKDRDMILKLPYQAFLLQDGEMNILIDNGMSEDFTKYGEKVEDVTYYSTSMQLLESLKEEGLSPDDIDLVIYTHLHADHAGNAKLFPKTKSVVQKDEWQGILNTCPMEETLRLYDSGAIKALQNNPNLLTIDGDMELMEGIRLVKTSGHTRGHQSLIVNTVYGLRIFAGDQFHLPMSCFTWMDKLMDADGVNHDITPSPELPVIPSSLVLNYYDYYESANKLKALLPENDPKYLVCGHDASLKFKGFK